MATVVGEEIEDASGGDVGETSDAVSPARLWDVVVAGIVVVGILLRFYSRSNLWLDEALSVNIARQPVGDIFEALRHDGHPPLYYVLLHYWMDLFGEGDNAVRALSGIFGVAALPLAWIAGRRLAGPAGARWALVVVCLSPYWIRYSTETRMYSLVMLLALGGYLLLTDAVRKPAPIRLAGLCVISGMLLLSHYWAFWLVAAVELMLAWRWYHRRDERPAVTKVILAVAAGWVFFLPWVPGFLYQSSHTGTPWADPVRPTALLEVLLQDLGGGEFHEGKLAGMALLVVCLLGLFVVRSGGDEMVLDVRTSPTVRLELTLVALTAAIGWLTAYATGATFQSRYAAVIVPFVLLAGAVGLTVIPGRAQVVAGVVFVGLSVAGIGWVEYYERTQSGPVATAIEERAEPGDVVVFCPDQLGPAFSRELPDDLDQLVYPTLESPDVVDWVDYADRNAAADPGAIGEEIRREYRGHAVFMVWAGAGSYKTFGRQCEDLIGTITQGQSEFLVQNDETKYYEPANLEWIPSV